jgi:short-subunit dehydrogenase
LLGAKRFFLSFFAAKLKTKDKKKQADMNCTIKQKECGKVALITGTTSGIGYALCEKFAQEKTDIILVSRNDEKLAEQQAYLQSSFGIKTWAIQQDLELSEAAHSVYTKVCDLKLDVDYLVHNAGFNEAGKFIETSIEKEKGMIQLHIVFVTELTKLILPSMMKRKSGKILFLGSTGSYVPCALDAVYAATKAYTLFFSKAIRAELKGTGITVTTLCPGATQTNFAEKAGIHETLLFKLFVMKPKKVAHAGYKSMMRGKAKHIPGLYSKLMVISSKILPTSFINYLTIKMLTKNKNQ